MRKVVLGALIAAAAAALLASAIGTASASRLSVAGGAGMGFRAVWSSLRFDIVFLRTPLTAICPVTLEGSFHSRTMTKVLFTLIGNVTRAVINEAACRGPTRETEWPMRVEFLTGTLPWHVRFGGFDGTLPSIEAVKIQITGASIRLSEAPIGWSCLYRATTAVPMIYRLVLERGRAVSEVSPETGSPAVPLASGELCNTVGLRAEGSGSFSQLGTALRVTITLI